ncbi:hypothetical protein V6N13_079865 [Hibiscus sabdariffa]|uniref:RING-type domain-containing protein n=1 Tax=Hibiscus sabdariffa TaxID=183260 RepID=A0ABR2RTE7_9ROSI
MSAADSGRNNPVRNRTLLDIIREDRSIKDKKSWKTFRDKLRLKRAGSAWTSSVHVPTSDVNVHSSRPRSSGRGEDRGERVSASNPPVAKSKMHLEKIESVHFGNNSSQTDDDDSVDAPRSRSFNRPMVRHASIRMSSANADDDEDVDGSDDDYESSGSEKESERPLAALTEERSLSAREAVAAQEAAEAAAAAAAGAEQPVKMSLMDLLGETGYAMGEDEENDEEEEEEEEENVVASRGGMEYTCCVCMVRHKGSAFIPCAHTFCRLCSRELMVQRGNCPLCRGYILEILDIF